MVAKQVPVNVKTKNSSNMTGSRFTIMSEKLSRSLKNTLGLELNFMLMQEC